MELIAWLAFVLAFCVLPPMLFALQRIAQAAERIAAALEAGRQTPHGRSVV
ncbi:MAG: hypothetical protein L6Q99_01015 [Planctomycetes bacterium]|nr:hypothetical protein [Planctomycetota bacterium]